jgi:hypothetical protein
MPILILFVHLLRYHQLWSPMDDLLQCLSVGELAILILFVHLLRYHQLWSPMDDLLQCLSIGELALDCLHLGGHLVEMMY